MESKQRLLEPQLVQTGRADQFSRKVFCDGMRDGVPIALGYFAVSFSLGIAARKAGFTPFQGFLVSLLNNASAGEYVAFALIMANATYFEVAVITLIANARYLLMSCALAQRFAPETPFWHRLLIGYDVTDELFGITIARPGSLNPYYTYGAILLAAPAWASGTALGIPSKICSSTSCKLLICQTLPAKALRKQERGRGKSADFPRPRNKNSFLLNIKRDRCTVCTAVSLRGYCVLLTAQSTT